MTRYCGRICLTFYPCAFCNRASEALQQSHFPDQADVSSPLLWILLFLFRLIFFKNLNDYQKDLLNRLSEDRSLRTCLD